MAEQEKPQAVHLLCPAPQQPAGLCDWGYPLKLPQLTPSCMMALHLTSMGMNFWECCGKEDQADLDLFGLLWQQLLDKG